MCFWYCCSQSWACWTVGPSTPAHLSAYFTFAPCCELCLCLAPSSTSTIRPLFLTTHCSFSGCFPLGMPPPSYSARFLIRFLIARIAIYRHSCSSQSGLFLCYLVPVWGIPSGWDLCVPFSVIPEHYYYPARALWFWNLCWWFIFWVCWWWYLYLRAFLRGQCWSWICCYQHGSSALISQSCISLLCHCDPVFTASGGISHFWDCWWWCPCRWKSPDCFATTVANFWVGGWCCLLTAVRNRDKWYQVWRRS